VKGTIRERKNNDGTTSYVCQVFAGRDPGSGRPGLCRAGAGATPAHPGDAQRPVTAMGRPAAVRNVLPRPVWWIAGGAAVVTLIGAPTMSRRTHVGLSSTE
jgi:hypothetical protein